MVLVIESLSSDKNSFGLNDKNKGDSVISKTRQQGILYSTDNIQGGNLKHFASEERNTHNLDFMYEYVSETEITLYIWRLSEVSKATIGTTEITVFKQPHHLINGVWEKSTAMEGSAIIKRMKNNQSNYINAIIPSEWTIGAPVKS